MSNWLRWLASAMRVPTGAARRLLHMADVPVERAHRTLGMQLDALFAAGVADSQQRAPVGQPLTQAVAHAVGDAQLAHRAFPQAAW